MTEWRNVGYLRKPDRSFEYSLTLPRPLADWDVWDYWEKERIHSMQNHLTHDDVLIDVGAEHGWMSLVFAQMVGPTNLVLVEPTDRFWPNIRATWERNHGQVLPRATWRGLFAADTTATDLTSTAWPAESEGPLIDRLAYTYIHEHPECPRVRLDDWVTATGMVPTALTIDVEGAEWEILRGAEQLLEAHRPKLWVSLHPDLMLRDYDSDAGLFKVWLRGFGYTLTHLATDHEEHWLAL